MGVLLGKRGEPMALERVVFRVAHPAFHLALIQRDSEINLGGVEGRWFVCHVVTRFATVASSPDTP